MLKKIHKTVGISFALIILHLAVTGLILMYPSFFNLYDKYYKSDFFLSAFNMYMHSDVKVVSSKEDIIVIGPRLILDEEVLDLKVNKILGAYPLKNDIAVISPSALFLIKEDDLDYIVKELKTFIVPLHSIGIGEKEHFIIIDEENNNFIVSKNNQEYIFIKTHEPYEKINLVATDFEKADFYLNLVQGPGVQALRLFTDLHNGRFFGIIVMFVFTLASISIIFLAISGSYMTLKPILKRKYFKPKNK
ncbi:MAG: hypothetical protein CFH32_01432 [Alphaproteobacteria bacterium MarineAlpha9_Bin2]|nr:MAG: hypothetical protein CFH32_01432 [Alphaproteobacteria bacterium MarineAlpha9_Bin2]